MRRIESSLIYQNAHIDIVHDACKLCYKGNPEQNLERKLDYIQSKIKLGHESVIAHSNVIIMVTDFKSKSFEEYAEVLSAGNFLRSVYKTEGKITYYLFGGSIRAFKGIYRNIKNNDNIIAKKIMESLYRTPKEYYYDFIESGIMNERDFIDSEFIYTEMKKMPLKVNKCSNKVEITNMDNIDRIMANIYNNSVSDDYSLFDYDDILDLCSITVYFKDMSRIISQQATRHFAGISQQSQRYVDESNCLVNNPLEFTDYIDKDKKFNIDGIGEVTLDELGVKLASIYSQLRQQGLKKEDARFYLPQGVKTSLYMTFTLRNLIHFISLRMEKAAQHEIRLIAQGLLESLENYLHPILGDDIFKYLIPKYVLDEIDYNYDNIDECIEIIEE